MPVLTTVVRSSVAALFLGAYGQIASPAEPGAAAPTITSVLLHRSACFGSCSVYSVEVLSNGEVRYNGQEHVKTKGHRTAHISADDFNFLVTSIGRVGFFALNDRYRFETDGCPSVRTDNPTVDIVVTQAEQKKRVSYYYGCRGLGIYQRIIWLSETIDDVANSAQWVGAEAE
jgi:Domain of unknown function (DUF6438)